MNLFSLAKAFPTEDAAVEYWIATRWPDGVRCVGCDHDTVYRINTVGKTGKAGLVFECGKCRLHFSPTAGTLFHDSHLPLQTLQPSQSPYPSHSSPLLISYQQDNDNSSH